MGWGAIDNFTINDRICLKWIDWLKPVEWWLSKFAYLNMLHFVEGGGIYHGFIFTWFSWIVITLAYNADRSGFLSLLFMLFCGILTISHIWWFKLIPIRRNLINWRRNRQIIHLLIPIIGHDEWMLLKVFRLWDAISNVIWAFFNVLNSTNTLLSVNGLYHACQIMIARRSYWCPHRFLLIRNAWCRGYSNTRLLLLLVLFVVVVHDRDQALQGDIGMAEDQSILYGRTNIRLSKWI